VAKQLTIHLNPDAARYILEKTCADRIMARVPCGEPTEVHEDPLSELLIRATCPGRPSSKSTSATPVSSIAGERPRA